MFAQARTREEVPTIARTGRLLYLLERASRAAARTPILIRGEAGVGKDTLARLICDASDRLSRAFVKVDCTKHPSTRLDVDLFGHERGATTAAVRRTLGGVEFANRGTLYLDTIEAVPNTLIPRLLRVVQTGEVLRTGSAEVLRVDVRLIVSTANREAINGDLWRALQELDVVELFLPPLRQRIDEIPAFASFFLERLNRRYKRDVRLCSDVIREFQTRRWPGNLRELAAAVHEVFAFQSQSLGSTHPGAS